MKALSEASVSFCRAIRQTTRFGEKASLIVSKETVSLSVDHLLVETNYPWKKASVDVSLPIEVLEIIPHILQSLHSIDLVVGQTKLETEHVVKFLQTVLSSEVTPKLSRLVIMLDLFDNVLHDVFASPQVQSCLASVKHLVLAESSRSGKKTYYITSRAFRGDDDDDDDDWDEEEQERPFLRNFLQLALVPNMALETFNLSKVDTLGSDDIAHVKFIPRIVGNNRDTLTVLSLHLSVWHLEEMKGIRLACLKSLTLTAFDKDQEIVGAFITNQSLLEQLDISIKNDFHQNLFAVVQGRSTRLKKLHIKAKYFNGFPGDVDWRFLGQLKDLKDFKIRRPICLTADIDSYGTGTTFLLAFGAENKLKRLSLEGISETGFWRRQGTREEPEIEYKIELLSKFTRLEELSLVRCGESVNDDLIQWIFKEMRSLTKLEISHCSKLTDAGLTGKGLDGNDDSGVSLKNLKGTGLSLFIHEFKCPDSSVRNFLILRLICKA
jgi:hypothetical protein